MLKTFSFHYMTVNFASYVMMQPWNVIDFFGGYYIQNILLSFSASNCDCYGPGR